MASKTLDDYAAMQRDYYNSRATNLGAARRLVHPDFTFAAGQAPGFAHWLFQQYFATCGASGRSQPPARNCEPQAELRPSSAVPRPRGGLAARMAGKILAARRRALELPVELLKGTFSVLHPGVTLVEWSEAASATRAQDIPLPRCLDFGCGVGRIMRPVAVLGARVDGVDISREMLSHAKNDPVLKESTFFESAGIDCGAALSSSYDLVYSAICMQHIATRAVRLSILRDMRRVLRNGGMVAIQFHYYPNLHDKDVPRPHVPWTADAFDARGTNSEADVWITPESIATVLEDFRQHFSDPALFFCEFPDDAKLFRGAYGDHRFEHLIVTATAGRTRADSIYGLEAP